MKSVLFAVSALFALVTVPSQACDLSMKASATQLASLRLAPAVVNKDLAEACYNIGAMRDPMIYLFSATHTDIQNGDPTCRPCVTVAMHKLAETAHGVFENMAAFCGEFFPFGHPVPKGDWEKLAPEQAKLSPMIDEMVETFGSGAIDDCR